MHGELLITQPSGAGIAYDNAPATGVGGDQSSVGRSFVAGKPGQNALWSKTAESLVFGQKLKLATHRKIFVKDGGLQSIVTGEKRRAGGNGKISPIN